MKILSFSESKDLFWKYELFYMPRFYSKVSFVTMVNLQISWNHKKSPRFSKTIGLGIVFKIKPGISIMINLGLYFLILYFIKTKILNLQDIGSKSFVIWSINLLIFLYLLSIYSILCDLHEWSNYWIFSQCRSKVNKKKELTMLLKWILKEIFSYHFW